MIILVGFSIFFIIFICICKGVFSEKEKKSKPPHRPPTPQERQMLKQILDFSWDMEKHWQILDSINNPAWTHR